MPFPVDAKFVRQAEEKLFASFPSSFKGRMLRGNGGGMDAGGDTWELYPFLDFSDRKRLARTCTSTAVHGF